jgi:hypothetical protein
MISKSDVIDFLRNEATPQLLVCNDQRVRRLPGLLGWALAHVYGDTGPSTLQLAAVASCSGLSMYFAGNVSGVAGFARFHHSKRILRVSWKNGTRIKHTVQLVIN